MAQCNYLLDGDEIYKRFSDDLSQVTDHSYVIDEIYSFYADWCRRGEVAVDNYCRPLYPVFSGSPREEQEEARENFIALRNAMINLYCAIDRATPGMVRHRVQHAAYYPEDSTLIIVVN